MNRAIASHPTEPIWHSPHLRRSRQRRCGEAGRCRMESLEPRTLLSIAPLTNVTSFVDSSDHVHCQVVDPRLGTMDFMSPNPDFDLATLVPNVDGSSGVVTWAELTPGGGAELHMAVYDPLSQAWQVHVSAGYDPLLSNVNSGGVVAWTVPSPSGIDVVHAATYDPRVGWQETIGAANDPGAGFVSTLIDRNGVVAWVQGDALGGGNAYVYGLLYDANFGSWRRGSQPFASNLLPADLSLNVATVQFVDRQGIARSLAYDASAGAWSVGLTTSTRAYFWTGPITGRPPFDVFYFDESIGANQWTWTFADGSSNSSQSGYHLYMQSGRITETVRGPGGIWNNFAVITAINITWTVTSTADDGSAGTLRYAVAHSAPGDTIQFDPTVFALGSQHTIHVDSQLELTHNLAINGPGSSVLSIDGDRVTRLLEIDRGVTVNLGGLTLSHASGGAVIVDNNAIVNASGLAVYQNAATQNGNAAGIYNSGGSLNVHNCSFLGNAGGSAIENTSGFLNVSQTTFSGNSGVYAGGITCFTGTGTVTSCTFFLNTGGGGAGIFTAAPLIISSCTFVQNIASNNGGALEVQFGGGSSAAVVSVASSTFIGNAAMRTGGGIFLQGSQGSGAVVTLNNTIVAGNHQANSTVNDIANSSGSLSGSYNLIGAGGLMNGVNGNIVGVTDPKLGPLADNGGPTQTMALLPGSPAIDAGSNALAVNADGTPLMTDQRGLPRISNGTVDIGAYELKQTRLIAPSVVGGAGALISLSATLSADGTPVPGEMVQFMLLGKPMGSAATDANGVATLPGVSLVGVSPGQYPRAIGAAFIGDATYGASSATADLFAAVSDPAPVGVTLGDGTAQRSEIRTLTLKFGQPVTLQAGAVTIALLNTGGSGANNGSDPTDATPALGTPTTPDGGATWIFKFVANTQFVDSTGSLLDGIYTATINQAKVIVSGGNSLSGASTGFTFHRLFGDINGDGTVNSADYFQFKKAFGSKAGSALYAAGFDFDDNGTINSTDYFKFRADLGKKFIGG